MKRLLLSLFVAGCLSACGGNPNAPSNFAQVSGSWTGNLQSSNWQSAALTMVLSQATATVTGTWATSLYDWNGTINGTVSKDSFTGIFTFSGPAVTGATRCSGTASINGGAGNTTMRWTSPGFTGSCTGLPLDITLNLQH